MYLSACKSSIESCSRLSVVFIVPPSSSDRKKIITMIHFAGLTLPLLAATMMIAIQAAHGKLDEDVYETKHIAVVFRHADRAPDPVELFPSDPHYESEFFPYGLGGLTNRGKMREYGLGLFLREKYDEFLGQLYRPKAVFARSTDYPRTKMCLQLVLSGLFPPQAEQVWNKNLPWQPIPTVYEAPKRDWLMIPEECPEYLHERNKIQCAMSKELKGYDEFLEKLTSLTGKDMTGHNLTEVYNLYHILTAETHLGLPIADWAKDYYPHGKILEVTNKWYEMFSKTNRMRRLNGGKLLRQIIDHMDAKIAGGDRAYNVSLFSGHETNVAAVLQVLGIYYPHVPAYSSAVIIELKRKVDTGEHYVEVIYRRGIPNDHETVPIPGCDPICPYDKFVGLLEHVTPTTQELACDKDAPFETNEVEHVC
ncbi:venom acid phosphatase Acph-1-like isoform X1 [Trichogramma pretiosum]|uniref:venom acid phosphatase Acph-1-like isoform X1 n=1 Tax=Trichogramma pretiosum TaxID=7493 RepID=UPI000C71A8BE|nr:venom acid phosphatase Acph-1-like isoform X1 [Trichogramma pretiosum]